VATSRVAKVPLDLVRMLSMNATRLSKGKAAAGGEGGVEGGVRRP